MTDRPVSVRTLLAAGLAAFLVGCTSGDVPDEGRGGERPATPAGAAVAPCASQTPGPEPLPEHFWGMHVSSPIGEGFPDAPIAAVNLTTSGVYWNQVETAPGVYQFDRLDAMVDTAEDRGARAMLVLGSTPSFHALGVSADEARSAAPDPAAWRAWVSAVVERYADRLDYQIWPEPNIAGNWAGTPEEMAELTVAASEVIRERAPDALVVAPATTLRLESQRDWMERFWRAEVDGTPVARSVDAVALDPFPLEDGTPEDSLDLVCEARAILDRHGVDLPVWTNEINYGVPSGGTLEAEPYPDRLQAAVVARTYLLHAATGLGRVYWLGWFSYPGLSVELARDGVPTAAGEAYAVVHDWLAGAPRPVCRVEGGTHTCLVDRKQEDLRVLWRERGTASVRVPEGVGRLETLSDAPRPVRSGDRVEITQEPVALVTATG